MTFPKWRHHPSGESMIVTNHDFEVSLTPDEDGWRDDRNFPVEIEEAPKKRGRWPKKDVA